MLSLVKLALLLTLCGLPLPGATSEGLVRVGVLGFGTVNWELDVIQHHQLAQQNGIALEVVPLASNNALGVALQGDRVDAIVGDWIWVTRQRRAGRPYTFFPYSLAVGALMVHPDSGIQDLGDLSGRALGVAGGPVGKSWLLMRAYSRATEGVDLADLVEPKFAAPPLLNQLMLRGEMPAALNYWHYGARLKAAGMRPLIEVAEVLPALGIGTPVPLLGWIFDDNWAAAEPERVEGLLSASYAAKGLLASSDAEWQRIRALTKAEDDATLLELREAYRRGIPQRFGTAEIEAAAKAFQVLAREGGSKLVGDSAEIAPGTFWTGFSITP